ncbi:MAG: ABC transporter ATP-binding protein [Actinobacteria bacterium]|nr:ABC transporter ATP-binding protein [Actinomycetota bacterium]
MSPGSNGASPAAPAAPALQVEGLVAGYGRTIVLRGVGLDVPAGGVVALLGPNGAGKTTLLRTISGLIPPTAGTVRMAGADITRMRAHRRFAAGLCHIPEGRGVFRGLTVRENLAMQAPKRGTAAAIERASDAFPVLADRLGQRAGTLSGGQQQMLAVAAAYTRDPSLVVIDEVSFGLAPLVLDEIFEFLRGLAAKGTALLIVDQFVSRALDLADHAYVLRRGSIVMQASGEDADAAIFEQYMGSSE